MNEASTAITILDGFHAWKHAVRFGASIQWCQTDDLAGVASLVASLAPDLHEHLVNIEVTPTLTLEQAARDVRLRTVHHTRLLAAAKRPADSGVTMQRAARRGRPVVFVDHARHAGNLGAVVRAVTAANGAGVLSTGEIDPWHADVVRAAAGTHFAIDVASLDPGGLTRLEGPMFGLDADGESLFTYDVPPDAVIAVGSERTGLSAEVRERLDGVVSLPMRAGVSSLNLATSVAAALYVLQLRSESGS